MLLALVAVLAVLGACAAWLYTPDKPRAALEAQYAQPPSAFVVIDGVRLHLRDTGPRDAPALVMLHGFGSSLHTWDDWALGLQDRFRVVRFDLPGFGLTGADPSADYSEARTTALLEGLMDHLRIGRATLVGNSMGGGIAWRFAAARPGRVERLVLVSPEGFPTPGEAAASPGDTPPRVPFVLSMMRYVLPSFVLRMNVGPSYADPAKLSDAVLARYRDMLLAEGNRDAILARMMEMPQRDRGRDPVPTLRGIRAPTLVMWGEQDRLIPFANAADYMAALPRATLAPLPTLGHVPQEEGPSVSLAPLDAFLRGG